MPTFTEWAKRALLGRRSTTARTRHQNSVPVEPLEVRMLLTSVVVNTNAGILGDDLAGFVGSLFLNVMRRVIMRQTTMPREQRVPVSVVADEFQTMTGTDFGALLGELQKNGGNFVLGTQALDNLRRIEPTGTLAGSIFAGVATKVVFQVNGDDARYLVERELDIERLRAESLVNLPQTFCRLKGRNSIF